MFIVTYMTKDNEDTRVSEDFKLKEFACKDGSPVVVIALDMLVRLQQLRNLIAIPLIITSAYRTIVHNKEVGGVVDSQHLTGEAVDLAMPKEVKTKRLLEEYAINIFDTCIVKDEYIHCAVTRHDLESPLWNSSF